MTEEPETETEREEAPARPPEAEKPPFNLDDLLRYRRGAKGEGPGFWEVLAYLDYKDRKEERDYRREEREAMKKNQTSSAPSPDVESLKTQVATLTKTVNDLLETIRTQQQEQAQKNFVDGVVKQTADKIMPELQAVKQKLDQYDQMLAKGEKPEFSLEELKETLTDAIDRIGEKVGAGGKTLTDVVSDVDKIMGLVETIEKRIKHGEGGEVDYKTMAVSTIGEIGKEMISAYRDIATTTAPGEAPKTETPASTMQTIIKRQVQNYITNSMKVGATTMNIQQAAKELGLTPGQVMWAYQTLMKEGWFHVQVASKGKKKVTETEAPPEEEISTETGEEEQVFNPPEI